MFWGLVLEPGKRYSTVVDKSFHVSMAALDCTSVKKDSEIIKVIVETEDQENLLCNLSKEKGILQEKLDLNFMTGDNITFECKGSGIVHLSGYLVFDDFEMEGDEEDGEEDRDEESEESEIDSPTTAITNLLSNKQMKAEKRKGKVPPPQQNKKKKTLDEEAASDSESENESDEEEEMESEDEELDGGSEEEDEDAESDDEETEEETPVTSQQLTKQQKKQQNSASPQNKQQTPGKLNKSNIVNGVTPNQQQSGKKDKKKGQTPQTPGQNAATPKAKTPGGGEDGTPKKRVVEGGVVVKDVKIGNGQPAKAGKLVHVYYTGRLKSTNKVFDSVNKGEGFKFRLGKGEVIKGWDIGLNGMKVGGKRVITCPPNAAYGPKGSLPTIPPNSTLIFEVELKATN